MSDEEIIVFLMNLAGYVTRLHERSRGAAHPTNAGPKYHDQSDTREWIDEAFARWMGFRGEDEQEREMRNIRKDL